jgi:hypothetical protein
MSESTLRVLNGPNLFSRLAGYSQNSNKLSKENFCTEVLAHLFNCDPVFCRRFLKVIFSNRRMVRRFRRAQATSQETLGVGCRVDLVLRAGAWVHLVEIKISAGETLSGRWGQVGKPQIQRYIDLGQGHVTYLTTSDSLAPAINYRGRKFRMKHAHFEDLHEALDGRRATELTKMFLEFMEENGMSRPRPFDRKDLQRAEQAFDFQKRCQATLSIVGATINDRFRRNLKTRAKLTRPGFDSGPDWALVRSYLDHYRRGAIWFVGIILEPADGNLDFAVCMWGNRDPSIPKIRDHIGWKIWGDDRGCYSPIHLHGNRNDVQRMVDHAISASRALGRAIKRYA